MGTRVHLLEVPADGECFIVETVKRATAVTNLKGHSDSSGGLSRGSHLAVRPYTHLILSAMQLRVIWSNIISGT